MLLPCPFALRQWLIHPSTADRYLQHLSRISLIRTSSQPFATCRSDQVHTSTTYSDPTESMRAAPKKGMGILRICTAPTTLVDPPNNSVFAPKVGLLYLISRF